MNNTINKTLFSMENVSVSYGNKHILKDISFSIDAPTDDSANGTMVGLLGANGSGKTTLLKAICHEIPYTGNCYLYEEALERDSVKKLAKKISYIPQRSGIHISMSVLDVVLMGYHPNLKLLERPTSAMIQQAENALQRVGISQFAHVDYLTLSEGEKQLCILARTLIENTNLLLLDEPDSALDFHNKYCMMKLLKSVVSDFGKTAILCLHDPALALSYCDQLLLLKDGTISDILYPKTDSIEKMEAAFVKLYGTVSLQALEDKDHGRRLVLLSEM